MKKQLILIAIIAVLLAACAPAEDVAPVEEEAQSPVEAPAEESAQDPAVEVEAEGEEPVEEPAAEEPAATTSDYAFNIVAAESEARFLIGEVLLGNAIIVVAVNSDVSGGFNLDYTDPASAEFGTISIDASGFVTDNDNRNRAIQRNILQSTNPDYAFITFTPTSVEGMPAAVEIGTTYDLQITGNLTVKDNTNPVTFAASMTAVSDTQIEGSASTDIVYTDFTTIPRLPSQVASVEEAMQLEFDFVAEAG